MASSREWLEAFIAMYRNETCLWKIKCKDYHNRDLKRSAYNKLISNLREIDPQADKEAVVKKINNIKSTYKKEQKKVAGSKSGAGTSEIYSPKLWYYPLLAFLNEQEEPRSSRSNIIDDNIPEEELIDETQPPPAAYTGSETLPATETTSGSQPATASTSGTLPARDSTSELNASSSVVPPSNSKAKRPQKQCRYI
ncbi:hypothetical protein JTB14_028531 [Gonioctena quinquepunctata]|nr:hypothetical protein JTB14_028531 [Gonioctena quinquepunctata]